MIGPALKTRGGVFRAAALFLISALIICRLPAGAHTKKSSVLFDQGHGQRFLVEKKGDLDLSGLATVLQEEGLNVLYRRGPLRGEDLEGIDAFVISGPFAPFTTGEVSMIMEYLRGGGRLSVMLHIGHPVLPLLQALGVAVSAGVVNERENTVAGNPLDFRVTRLEPHPLHENLERYALYGAWGLDTAGGSARLIARTGTRAWIDTSRDRAHSPDEPEGPVGVVAAGQVGKGSFVVFGDDAIFQNRFLEGENLSLARNLAHWLAAKGKR